MIVGVDWTEAISLEEVVMQLFEARKTDSSEFKAMLAFYGRERIEKIYQKWKDSTVRGDNTEVG